MLRTRGCSVFAAHCKMSKYFIILFSVLFLVGCTQTPPPPVAWNSNEVQRPEIKKVLTVDFPEDWTFYEPGNTPFDRQAKSKDAQMNSGIFLYNRTDFEEGSDLKRILSLQVDDMGGKREKWTEVKEPTVTEDNGYRRATSVYSGVKDGKEFYYRFTAVESDQHDDVVATVLQVAFPDQFDTDEATLKRITDSIKFKSPE